MIGEIGVINLTIRANLESYARAYILARFEN